MKNIRYILLSMAFCPFLGFGQEVIDIGDNRELFVDDFLIDRLDGVVLKMHEPHDEGAVLYFDKPWEGAFCGYCTVIKDGDIFRVYYRGNPGGKDGTNIETTCIAESKDGVHWEKPNLKLYEISGTLDNNVVLANQAPSSHNFSPFLDTNPDVKSGQRYKALAGEGKNGLVAYASPDGIHWEKIREDGVFKKGVFDSQNVSFWSESEKLYLCYFRIWTGKGYSGIRSVARTTSVDFINWTDPDTMTFGNTPLEHLYTQQTSPYFRAPHIYFAIGGRFIPGKQILSEEQAKALNVNPSYFKDCADVYMMSSRGSNRYDRTFMEAFIRPGIGLNNWVSRSNYPALNVVQTGEHEMSLYVNQDYAQPTAHLQRYSMRIDGFASLSAPYKGGEVVTKPLLFSGKFLEINYSTSAAGELRFEIQDEKGIVIQGFGLDDSDMITGNEISRIVSWSGKNDLSALSAKTIRLRIYLKDADLYSLRFKDNKEL
ncbi:MAG: hypothetical protein LBR84_12450 [Tannerella sp.]|nr:hypothetical protein [Tannerella sp.]